jgi:hypothetical protein
MKNTQFRGVAESHAFEGQGVCAGKFIPLLFCALILQTGCVFLPISDKINGVSSN